MNIHELIDDQFTEEQQQEIAEQIQEAINHDCGAIIVAEFMFNGTPKEAFTHVRLNYPQPSCKKMVGSDS